MISLMIGMSTDARQQFVEKVKKEHVGKWIAVRGNEVVAVSESHEELIRELKRRELDDVYVFYSASPMEREYQFLFLVWG